MRATAAWGAAFLAILLIFAWIVTGSDSFQACLAGDNGDLDETSFIRHAADDVLRPTTLQCVGEFLDQNEPTILALTAIAVTFFGFGVWSAGRRLQRAALALVAERENTSRLRSRPQVGIESIDDDGAESHVFVTVKNFGLAPARQVRMSVTIATEPPAGRSTDARETGAVFTLLSGQNVTVPVALEPNIQADAQSIYVSGHIRYVTLDGQRWRSDFCWSAPSRALVRRFGPYGTFNDDIAET